MPEATSAPLRQVEALEAFVALLGRVDEDEGYEAFYGRLAEAMCGLSGMRRAIVFRYDPALRRVAPAGVYGMELGPAFAEVPVTIESVDFAREALLQDRVQERLPPFEGHVPEPFLRYANAGPLVCVPMCAGGRMIGVVFCQRDESGGSLDDGLRDWLWTLGKVAALAATARISTYQQERARGLEERIDLAREIHDRVVQRLFGVSLALSATTADLTAEDRARCATEISTALADLQAALHRPLGREPRPVASTLAEELERLRHIAGAFELQIAGEATTVPPALEPLAQAVFAEAIANAQKHARPRTIEVAMRHEDRAFVLEVANDGVGARGARAAAWAWACGSPRSRRCRRAGSSSSARASPAGGRCGSWCRTPPRSQGRELDHATRCGCSSSTTTTSCTGASASMLGRAAVGRALPGARARRPRRSRSPRASRRTSRSSTCSSGRSPARRSASGCGRPADCACC